MNLEDLHEASYRGVFFFVDSSETTGGRKDAKKKIVDSNRQVIEDFGLDQRIFVVSGVITQRQGTNGEVITPYIQARDAFLQALEKGGTGILIHPWYGRLENIVARTWVLNETLARLGIGLISITFEISNTDGVPIATEFVLTKVVLAHEEVLEIAKTKLEELWDATSNIFQDGIDKANNFINAVNEATRPLAAVSTEINKHTNLISNFSTNVTTLVNNPQQLSDSVFSIMDSVGGLYSSAEGTIIAFKGLFDFGDDDIDAPQTTKIAIDRKRNNDAYNATTQAMALSFSYLNASQVEYETVDAIVEAASDLEIQYQKLFESDDIDGEVMEALTELRTITQGFFDEQKLTANQVIIVQTNPMSTRLIAFAYYGSSELGEPIAELNMLYDSVYHQGDLRIFTE